MPFCRLFHSPAAAISCSESGDCSFYYRTPPACPSKLCSTLYTEGGSETRTLVGLYFFHVLTHFVLIQIDTSEFNRNLKQPIFCQALKTKGEKVKMSRFAELKALYIWIEHHKLALGMQFGRWSTCLIERTPQHHQEQQPPPKKT